MSQTESQRSKAGDPNTAVITRDFDFPRATLFRYFTDPKKAAKWFGTPEVAVTVLFELDARPGGTLRIHDQEPGGPVHETSGTVLEVVEPELFSFKSSTALTLGAPPFEALQTVTLEEVSPTKTRVTVVVQVLSAESVPGGVPALLEGFQGGWGETFDKLQRLLP